MRPVTFTSSVLTPYERGVEFGEHFAARITGTVAGYRQLFAAVAADTFGDGAADAFDVDLWSERAWQTIRELAPEHAAEIQGIADGARRPVQDLAAVNARTELLVAANPSGISECSTVVSWAPGRAPVAVQTWDWYDAMSEGWLHWRIPYPDGRHLETVTEFGMLAKIGVNDRGTGVLLNMLHHENDAKAAAEGRVGHPVHLLSRSILEDAEDTAAGVRIASAARTSASTALTVVDAGGAAASVELYPGGPGVREPEAGLLVRTNHFVSASGRDGCLASTISNSSEIRRQALLDAFADRTPSDRDDVLAGMRHHHAEGGVCSHVDERLDPRLRHRTLATVSIDVVGRRLDVHRDGPCATPIGPA